MRTRGRETGTGSARPRRAACALFALSLVFASSAAALDPGKALTQYDRAVFETRDGLPQNSVWAVTQTLEGYLWLGTQEGLVRFDGVRFETFDAAAGALPHSFVTSLAAADDGTLWAGTPSGLARYSEGRFSAFLARDGLTSGRVWSLEKEPGGALLVGTSGGLDRVLAGRISSVRKGDETTFRARISAIHRDRSGALWIGSNGGGLTRISPDGATRVFGTAEGLPDERVTALCPAADGSLLVGTYAGVCRVEGERLVVLPLPGAPLVYALLTDRQGSLFVGTRNAGLLRLHAGRIESLSAAEGLPDSTVRSLFEDREGNLWVGTSVGGLVRLSDRKFVPWGRPEGLRADVACAILEDRRGTLWIGTDGGGLHRLEGGRLVPLTDPRLPSSPCALADDPGGALWIGTNGSGLYRLSGKSLERIGKEEGLPDETVLSLFFDRRGALWVGTRFGGIAEIPHPDEKHVQIVRRGEGGFAVLAIREAPDGALWFATGGGLLRLSERGFTRYGEHERLSTPIILALWISPEGTVWGGTNGGGLVRVKDGRTAVLTSRDGLFDDTVFLILEDDRGSLWMSSNKGVFRAARRDLEACADRRLGKVPTVAYGASDGMRSRECVGGYQSPGTRTRDGRLWFATIRGVASLDPSHLEKNPVPPGVRIEEVLADHVTVGADGAGTLRVPAGRRSLEVRYTGLSFAAPERVRFRYRLEKFDRDWVDAGTRRTAYYTNLPPGRYRFRVAACNEDGLWNEAGASARLSLLARFWQTPLFFALCAAAAALLVLWMHRVNVRDLATRFAVVAERNRLAGEIHDSLAQGFTGVVLQLEAAEKALREGETPPRLAERVRAHLLRARTLARESLEDARRSVWALRPKVLEDSDLVSAVRAAAEELSEGTARHVEVEVEGRTGRSSPDVEDELLRVVREALANSLLHSDARNIRVTFAFSFRRVTVVVKDDGKGFSEAEADGFGLTSMRTRLKRLGGRFTVTSAPGRGTTIQLVAPRPLLGRARRKK